MSERIEPRLEHRIVDGEMLSVEIDEKIQRGKEFSEKKEILKETDEEKFAESFSQDALLDDPDSILKDYKVNPQVSISQIEEAPSFIAKYGTLMGLSVLSVSVIAAIAVFVYTSPESGGKDPRVSELESQIAQLSEQNKTFSQQLNTMDGVSREQIVAEINTAIGGMDLSSKGGAEGVEKITGGFDQKWTQVEEKLSISSKALEEKIRTTRTDLEAQIKQVAETSRAAQPTDQDSSEELVTRLNELEKTLDKKLKDSADEIKANSVKVAELIENQDQKTALLSGDKLKLGIDTPLESFQIQQWIVEINTQWILYGRMQETQQQLFALEQAVSLSEFAYTTQLARLIGQDLSYLKQLKENAIANQIPTTAALKKSVSQLKYEQIGSDVPSPGEDESLSALDKLVERFSNLVSVKKRESEEEIMKVNSILHNDVLKQRLALLVDRLDWGVTVESNTFIKQASVNLQTFIDRHYPAESNQFKELLLPFEDVEFSTNRPLSILKLDEAMQ